MHGPKKKSLVGISSAHQEPTTLHAAQEHAPICRAQIKASSAS
jgi:hypothetical protein